MKIVQSDRAKIVVNSDTSKLLEYSMELNDKDVDFCINTISGRYPEKGYCSNLECEELCYVLDGTGHIYKKGEETIEFKAGDIIFLNKKDIYYWEGNFKVAIVCTPAWSKEQCKLYDE